MGPHPTFDFAHIYRYPRPHSTPRGETHRPSVIVDVKRSSLPKAQIVVDSREWPSVDKCPGYGPGALAPLRNSRLSVAHSVRSSGFCVGIGSTTLPLFTGDSGHASINLSKATRLKSVTSEHRDLRQVLINVPFDFPPGTSSVNIRRVIGETTYGPRPPPYAVLGVTFDSSKDKAQRCVAERRERSDRLCTVFVVRDDEKRMN